MANILTSDEKRWQEITEESAPANNQRPVSDYFEDEGLLRELVIVTPFDEKIDQESGGISPDASALVMTTPEESQMADGPLATNQRVEIITYIVEAGDVLSAIAEKFDITVNTILWANNLSWSSTIRPGQKLKILPMSGVDHEIKSGDTVLSIAKKYQADTNKIVEANKLADASDIKIGDLLFVPEGVMPTKIVSSYVAPTYTTPQQKSEPEQPIDSGAKLFWPSPSKKLTQYYSWRHHGLDIGDKMGNPIFAAESGKVERAGWNSGYGYNVVINHGNGIKTLYGHASKLLVEAGETVERGQTIALIGSTGWSTGPHLHFEVIVSDVKKNPLNYIK